MLTNITMELPVLIAQPPILLFALNVVQQNVNLAFMDLFQLDQLPA